jgi:hypothetical protein
VLAVEVHLDVLSETGGVVVADGLSVTEAFQDRIGSEDLIFYLQ